MNRKTALASLALLFLGSCGIFGASLYPHRVEIDISAGAVANLGSNTFSIPCSTFVRNVGDNTVDDPQATMRLDRAFADILSVELIDHSGPLAVGPFDGVTDTTMYASQSGGLAPGAADTLVYEIQWNTQTRKTGTWFAQVTGTTSAGSVRDGAVETAYWTPDPNLGTPGILAIAPDPIPTNLGNNTFWAPCTSIVRNTGTIGITDVSGSFDLVGRFQGFQSYQVVSHRGPLSLSATYNAGTNDELYNIGQTLASGSSDTTVVAIVWIPTSQTSASWTLDASAGSSAGPVADSDDATAVWSLSGSSGTIAMAPSTITYQGGNTYLAACSTFVANTGGLDLEDVQIDFHTDVLENVLFSFQSAHAGPLTNNALWDGSTTSLVYNAGQTLGAALADTVVALFQWNPSTQSSATLTASLTTSSGVNSSAQAPLTWTLGTASIDVELAQASAPASTDGGATFSSEVWSVVRNTGTEALVNVQAVQNLSTEYQGFTSASVVYHNGPLAISGSWNGSGFSNLYSGSLGLAAGAKDSARYRVNWAPTSASSARDSTKANGTSPLGARRDSTFLDVFWTLGTGTIDVQIAAGSITDTGNGGRSVPIRTIVQNTGSVALSSVQLTSAPALDFQGFTSATVSTHAGPLTPNGSWDGSATTSMYDPAQTLVAGAKDTLDYIVAFLPTVATTAAHDVQADATSPFGPRQDIDIANVNWTLSTAALQVAMAGTAVTDNLDGTFSAACSSWVRNTGTVNLTSAQVTANPAADFQGFDVAAIVSHVGTLTTNGSWDGDASTSLYAAGQTLTPGQEDLIVYSLDWTPTTATSATLNESGTSSSVYGPRTDAEAEVFNWSTGGGGMADTLIVALADDSFNFAHGTVFWPDGVMPAASFETTNWRVKPVGGAYMNDDSVSVHLFENGRDQYSSGYVRGARVSGYFPASGKYLLEDAGGSPATETLVVPGDLDVRVAVAWDKDGDGIWWEAGESDTLQFDAGDFATTYTHWDDESTSDPVQNDTFCWSWAEKFSYSPATNDTVKIWLTQERYKNGTMRVYLDIWDWETPFGNLGNTSNVMLFGTNQSECRPEVRLLAKSGKKFAMNWGPSMTFPEGPLDTLTVWHHDSVDTTGMGARISGSDDIYRWENTIRAGETRAVQFWCGDAATLAALNGDRSFMFCSAEQYRDAKFPEFSMDIYDLPSLATDSTKYWYELETWGADGYLANSWSWDIAGRKNDQLRFQNPFFAGIELRSGDGCSNFLNGYRDMGDEYTGRHTKLYHLARSWSKAGGASGLDPSYPPSVAVWAYLGIINSGNSAYRINPTVDYDNDSSTSTRMSTRLSGFPASHIKHGSCGGDVALRNHDPWPTQEHWTPGPYIQGYQYFQDPRMREDHYWMRRSFNWRFQCYEGLECPDQAWGACLDGCNNMGGICGDKGPREEERGSGYALRWAAHDMMWDPTDTEVLGHALYCARVVTLGQAGDPTGGGCNKLGLWNGDFGTYLDYNKQTYMIGICATGMRDASAAFELQGFDVESNELALYNSLWADYVHSVCMFGGAFENPACPDLWSGADPACAFNSAPSRLHCGGDNATDGLPHGVHISNMLAGFWDEDAYDMWWAGWSYPTGWTGAGGGTPPPCPPGGGGTHPRGDFTAFDEHFARGIVRQTQHNWFMTEGVRHHP